MLNCFAYITKKFKTRIDDKHHLVQKRITVGFLFVLDSISCRVLFDVSSNTSDFCIFTGSSNKP